MKQRTGRKDAERILISYGRPYMPTKALAEHFGICAATVASRLKEIEALIGKRYADTAVIRDGNLVLVNVLAFIDYEVYRQRLLDRNTARYVPPFDPVATRRDIGYNLFEEDSRPRLLREEA